MTDIITVAEPARQFEPGIYFGLSDTEYHADESLGSSKQKELVLDPIEYQYARLHGGEKPETFALKWGSGIHCRVLEGRASFAERFPVGPRIEDFPGVLVTMDHLRAHCKEIGVKPGKTKEEAIAAIRDFDEKVPIWDEIKGKFEAENVGKTIIPADAIAHIERAARWMQRDPELAPVMEDGTFTAGASEVSIFYTDKGIRLKARIDHLLASAVIDLKSFRTIMAEAVKPAAKRAISRMRYDLQAASYMKALRAASILFKEGRVFNNLYDAEFLETVFATVDAGKMDWIWVLIKASGAPQSVVAKFETESNIFKEAAVEIDDAIETYRSMVDKFGVDSDWIPESTVESWGDTDFPPWAFQ